MKKRLSFPWLVIDHDDVRFRGRSSVTGRFVSPLYALTHPRTTILERIRRKGDSK